MTTPEGENAPLWRYADWLKLSAVTAVVEHFSTREPAQETLRKVFGSVARELSTLIAAEAAYHLFTNPDLQEFHLMRCDGQNNDYVEQKGMSIRIPLAARDPFSWMYYRSPDVAFVGEEVQPQQIYNDHSLAPLWSVIGKPGVFAIAPFCQRDMPLGFFIFCWNNCTVTPELLTSKGRVFRENGALVTNYMQEVVGKLFTNHFPLHRDTYLPKFMETTSRGAAILFADIRNFTSAFESMRHQVAGMPDLRRILVGLVKAYLDASSEIIAQPGIGRIDKFLGDGIMALFGEHLLCGPPPNDSHESVIEAACLLSTYSGAMLVDAFRKLFTHFLELAPVDRFLRETNDSLDLRIGIGITSGEVLFDYFGNPKPPSAQESRLIGGYLEYTVVGETVNIAKRLEAVASKPKSEAPIVYRSPDRERKGGSYIAPLVVGRPTFIRIKSCLRRPTMIKGTTQLSEYYKSTFELKGKGNLAETYEIWPEELDGGKLVLTLKSRGLQHLGETVEKHWNDSLARFEFPDDRARVLINNYCL